MQIAEQGSRIAFSDVIDSHTNGKLTNIQEPATMLRSVDVMRVIITGIHAQFHSQGAKTIKKNTNSTQNKSETRHAKQYEVT